MKTLKSFRRPKKEEGYYTGEYALGVNETCNKLKQTAIKQIKKLSKKEHIHIRLNPDYMTTRKEKCTKSSCSQLVKRRHQIKWIKEFFNITEKD